MQITPEQVRRDLQTVKKKLNTAAVLQDAIERHQSRVGYLKDYDAASTKETIIQITRQMEQALSEMAELESLYMETILKLKPLYKTVIIDFYINGKFWWEVSNKIHYEKQALFRVIKEAIEEISRTMEKAG